MAAEARRRRQTQRGEVAGRLLGLQAPSEEIARTWTASGATKQESIVHKCCRERQESVDYKLRPARDGAALLLARECNRAHACFLRLRSRRCSIL